jgi:hypothetical protein
MPDIPNRDLLEAEVARSLGRLFGSFSGHLLEILEEYNWDIFSIPESVWKTAITRKEVEVLLPFLERVAMASAEQLLTEMTIGVDWALVNQAAADWARSYSTLLAGQIDQTSRTAIASSIRNSIASFFEEGLTHGELIARLEGDSALEKLFARDVRDRLGRVYGPYRAEMIAVTETTRAAVEGERLTVREIEKYGFRMIEIWQTSNDDRVCIICAPRHNKKEGDGWNKYDGPPAHVRCRCWTNHEAVI